MAGYIAVARGLITRSDIQRYTGTVFVFGDNVEGWGRGGQAKEARGEINTIGIPTKWSPGMDREDFFYDDQFYDIQPYIDKAIQRIRNALLQGFDVVVFPNIGEGYARLPETAPDVLNYIDEQIEALFNEFQ